MNTETFLVDTGIWISSFSADKQGSCLLIRKLLKRLEREERVVVCGIILAEFARGLEKTKKEVEVLEILRNHEYLETTKDIYILAGQLSRELDKKGLRTPLADCLIATTAMAHGATLVTDDPHFKRFSGLKLRFIN